VNTSSGPKDKGSSKRGALPDALERERGGLRRISSTTGGGTKKRERRKEQCETPDKNGKSPSRESKHKFGAKIVVAGQGSREDKKTAAAHFLLRLTNTGVQRPPREDKRKKAKQASWREGEEGLFYAGGRFKTRERGTKLK